MARQRNPMRDEAYRIWIESNKEKKLKDIADELGVSPSTVRKWKSEDNWSGYSKRSAPNESERYESMKDNQNAKGNPGGTGAPLENHNALSHGLFAKHLPSETASLIQELYTSEPADIIWNNIMIQYTAIIRAQKIMYVQDINDISKEESAWSSGEGGSSTTLQLQYAWDKQASFLSAQSRAMGTLSNLIRQFVAIADERDERRLKLDLMQGQIDKLKSDSKVFQDIQMTIKVDYDE